jgi:hypothetical protein
VKLLPELLPELPEGVQIGAEHMSPETEVWVANVPADVGRLFRACLASVARRLDVPSYTIRIRGTRARASRLAWSAPSAGCTA